MQEREARRNANGALAPFGTDGSEKRAVTIRHLLRCGEEQYDLDVREYALKGLPEGWRRVRLDAKAWHDNLPALILYLTDLESRGKYRVMIFREAGKHYRVGGEERLDLDHVALGSILHVEARQSKGKGYNKITSARIKYGNMI